MDAHQATGGEGNGVLPMQALLGSLAGCVGMDVVAILRPRMDKIKRIKIVTEGAKNDKPPKEFTAITATFQVDGEVEPEWVWHAIRTSADKYCPVAHSILPELTYRLVLNDEETPEL
ncbi:OsmC family protein [Planococcus sp. FY231025]|uniref:OsmC family protein n=1 Tax=Planococcus sp. FY231025 TaxID=3455699 RepID=UPI003F8E6D27